ncbi:Sodium/hydrogen exchanger [Clathrospora elynae]|uniref:Sodium/hydrogen exchanger n=1 Tax=Clathrospora elynae TaxID=706981 RepID=A0A6A5SQI7_9PLEO|nr:Sodium/hydrogen exchanger [Clathrospora elynae]
MAADVSEIAASLPYHEPAIVNILVLTSLLLLLNVINVALDRVLYCGLLGQVLIGIAWGTPGAKWLSVSMEETIVQLGYLGLILLVYEGGLHTSFQSLKANLLLSSGVALTGIAVPIGLSYTLQRLLDATPVQAFAAGAALCSTSLGTTFTVLTSSGLASSRLGVVLTSAAMMDDVVGLVMVQVIWNLGDDSFSWVTVVRPVLVSVAFAVIVPLVCLLIARPLTLWSNSCREAHPTADINGLLQRTQTAFTIHTLLLIGLVTGASYAGTSNLFAAYIVGAAISWWDSEVPHPSFNTGVTVEEKTTNPASASQDATSATSSVPVEKDSAGPSSMLSNEENSDQTCGSVVYQHYYHPAVSKILQPFFFASVGFSIPITRMFKGAIVWRGIVYTVLMTFGKLVCGLWLVRLSPLPGNGALSRLLFQVKHPSVPHLWGKNNHTASTSQVQAPTEPRSRNPPLNATNSETRKPFSLYPALILALAMCARGEIGFLVSSIAESNGVFSGSGEASDQPSDIFLVVTWAIVLCTIIGPLGVGLSVRRMRQVQDRKNKQQEGARRDVLGFWGVE